MKKKTLVGINGNAYCIMGTVTCWMKAVYDDACIPDDDGQVDEVAKKSFDETAQDKYIRDATSGDYYHLLNVSEDMVNEINKYWGL